jgi:hypothetical protein
MFRLDLGQKGPGIMPRYIFRQHHCHKVSFPEFSLAIIGAGHLGQFHLKILFQT